MKYNSVFKCITVLFLSVIAYLLLTSEEKTPPKLPIGINLNSYNYYTNAFLFVDVMKSASEMISFNLTGSSSWDSKKIDKIPSDPQGYPLELPYVVDNVPQGVRFLINDYYKGRYIFLYDGEGEFSFGVPTVNKFKQTIILLDGKGENRWIDITKSKKSNPVRNIRILPEDGQYDPNNPFTPQFIEGLKSFNCLRFMDFMKINNSKQTSWETRSLPEYYTQGTDNGVAIEYAIQLCNDLKCDAWLCVPHKADDDFIKRYAELVRDTLDPNLKVYIEYSNELWNWGFEQSHYILDNAPGAINTYVSEALKNISPSSDTHPEKDAYMIQRTLKIWSEVFSGANKNRLIRIAAVQQAWVDNTRRILTYLFKYDEKGKAVSGKMYQNSLGAGCDAVSPSGYFGVTEETQKKWASMDPKLVTQEVVFNALEKEYSVNEKWSLDTAKYANNWKVAYVVYEGGQGLVPYQEKDNPDNESLWDAQINPKMFDMYMRLFRDHSSPPIECKLFNAYSYVSFRKTKWGSWGHLESLDQLNDLDQIKIIAPKYAALIESNIPKE